MRVVKNKGGSKRHYVKDAVVSGGKETAYTTACNLEFPSWWVEFVDDQVADCKRCLRKTEKEANNYA